MSTSFRKGGKAAVDLLVLCVAYCFGFLLRFEFDLTLQFTKLLFFTMPYVVLLQYGVLSLYGVPRFAWTFTGIREAYVVLKASMTSTAILVVVRLVAPQIGGHFNFMSIPFGVLGMNLVLSFCAIAGVRGLSRSLAEDREKRQFQGSDDSHAVTLLIGAGRAGMMVARELLSRPALQIRPVGFVDDDDAKHGMLFNGLTVYGGVDELPKWVEQTQATQALICIAAFEGELTRRISRACAAAGISAKVIPSLGEVVEGREWLGSMRSVKLSDLLRRPPVELDNAGISELISGRVVLVTGAGGSIGSEICRQALAFNPKRLVLVERAENALYLVHQELTQDPEFAKLVVPCLADVADVDRIDAVLGRYRPSIVLHAAAHKHVPMMEWNCVEAVKNNVGGSVALAERAVARGVDRFVMISTDKAVRPTSIMGATKRLAELCLQDLAGDADCRTRFTTVRFGNVLGSQGSVVPLFERQIANGGPVTVTHPDMQRYFMLIPEACQLVLQAATMGDGGELYVLDMGEPVKIVDLARDLIELSGLAEGVDIKIEFTGLRPGEKLYEELSRDDEELGATTHPAILRGHINPPTQDHRKDIDSLLGAARRDDEQGTRDRVLVMVPDYVVDGQGDA